MIPAKDDSQFEAENKDNLVTWIKNHTRTG
jgi:hypothetical protein